MVLFSGKYLLIQKKVWGMCKPVAFNKSNCLIRKPSQLGWDSLECLFRHCYQEIAIRSQEQAPGARCPQQQDIESSLLEDFAYVEKEHPGKSVTLQDQISIQ